MNNRYLGQDIRDQVITLLGDTSSGFNNYISTINTERTHSAPSANAITYKWGQNQYPFILVDLGDSEVLYEESSLDMSYVNLPEIYEVMVICFIKVMNDNIYNWIEDWIEAVIRVLHNYNDTNISYITYEKTERAEVYDKMNTTLKVANIIFTVRIN